MGEFKLYKNVEGMKYPQEDLNIERHHRVMITYALRKYKSPKEASKHLGITARTVFRMISKYQIDWRLIDINEDEL
tara:strand:- start:521 stop:748 length:228 start_codon:yes stop_codon:yes gene_type:complete